MANETILIIDFGSQVTQLIARRIREAQVYSVIVPFDKVEIWLQQHRDNLKGIILSGGPMSVNHSDAPHINAAILDLNLPILGICYGQQLLCQMLNGAVESGDKREFGHANLQIKQDNLLLTGIAHAGQEIPVWMSHGDHVSQLPDGFSVIGTSNGAPYALIANLERQFYGVQFHPEVTHTPSGQQILHNFARKICNCHGDWTMAHLRDQTIAAIRAQVGSNRVICGLSGGVDSTVTAVLLHEALSSDQLVCIFVDHGLLRQGEAEQVVSLFRQHYQMDLCHIDAGDQFMAALEGIDDPEQKRKIIGRLFIEVFQEQASQIENVKFLAQGTLYPDVIESVSLGSGQAVTIKSHHNVGGLPESLNLQLVEPLRSLFKDEVRALGYELGIDGEFIGRHPFPGPGLAIRIPGMVTHEKCEILRQADAIYLQAIREHGLYDQIWQAFAVLLPVRTVGVMGDARSYEYVCALRAVTSVDGMTSESYPFSHEFLTYTATRIINQVKGINRVVYDVTSKPPGTIEWE